MIIALLLVLVCTVVAAIITTSSSVDVERTNQYLKEQQAYYAVRSALDAADDMITTTGPIATMTLYADQDALSMADGDAGKSFTPYLPAAESSDVASQGDANGLRDWASSQASLVLRGQQVSVSKLRLNVHVAKAQSDSASIPDATLVFEMDPTSVANGSAAAYDIKVTAELAGDGADYNSDYNYALSKTFSATVSSGNVPSGDRGYQSVKWGPGSGTSPDVAAVSGQPTIGSSPTAAERSLSDVWDNISNNGDKHDDGWSKLWDKVVWSQTANPGTLVAYNKEGYAVLAYANGHYWAPRLSGPAAPEGYDGRSVAVKLVDDKSEYANLSFNPEGASSDNKNVYRRGNDQTSDSWAMGRHTQSVIWVQVQ